MNSLHKIMLLLTSSGAQAVIRYTHNMSTMCSGKSPLCAAVLPPSLIFFCSSTLHSGSSMATLMGVTPRATGLVYP